MEINRSPGNAFLWSGLCGAMDLMIDWLNRRTSKNPKIAKEDGKGHLLKLLFYLVDIEDNTAVILAASLAHTVRQLVFAAARALDQSGFLQLPSGRTSLVTSLTGYFTFRDSHYDTS